MNALQGRDLDENEQHVCRNCGSLTDRYDAARRRWLCGPACVEMFDWRLSEADGGGVRDT